jgi:hypothetical protein
LVSLAFSLTPKSSGAGEELLSFAKQRVKTNNTCIFFVHARRNQSTFDQLSKSFDTIRSFFPVQSDDDTPRLITGVRLSSLVSCDYLRWKNY